MEDFSLTESLQINGIQVVTCLLLALYIALKDFYSRKTLIDPLAIKVSLITAHET